MKPPFRLYIFVVFVLASLLIPTALLAQSPGTAFIYQGQLATDGALTSATCNFRFTLYDAESAGNAVGSPITRNGVAVSNGLFATSLDFGASAFTGAPRWLAIEVQCPGDAALIPLSPRQQLTPTPYAIYASDSGGAPWSGISGKPSWAINGYSAGAGLTLTGATFAVDTTVMQRRVSDSCDLGLAIRAVNADGTVECAATTESDSLSWHLGGNAGEDGQFLGTIDVVPLELRVNNRTALRLSGGGEPPFGALNIVVGETNNTIDAQNQGAVISGGKDNFNGADYGVVGGGSGNGVDGIYSVVAGGVSNYAAESASAVVGGVQNSAMGEYTFIGGGADNEALGVYGVVGGGTSNIATGINSFVPGGSNGEARLYGQMAHASGSFADPGDAQASEYVLRATLNTEGATELFLDGLDDRIAIPPGMTMNAEVQFVARTSTGVSGAQTYDCVVSNTGGTTTGTCVPGLSQTNGYVFSVTANNSLDALYLHAMRASPETAHVVATVRTTEVVFP